MGMVVVTVVVAMVIRDVMGYGTGVPGDVGCMWVYAHRLPFDLQRHSRRPLALMYGVAWAGVWCALRAVFLMVPTMRNDLGGRNDRDGRNDPAGSRDGFA